MEANKFVDKYLKVWGDLEEPWSTLWSILSDELKRIHDTMEQSLEQWLSEHFEFSRDDVILVSKILHYILSMQIARTIDEDRASEELDKFFKDFTKFISFYMPLFKW